MYSNDVCPIADPYGTVEHVSVHNDTCFNIVSISRLDDREKEGIQASISRFTIN